MNKKIIIWIMVWIIAIVFFLFTLKAALACGGEIIEKDGQQYCKQCESGFKLENGSCIVSEKYNYEPDVIDKSINWVLYKISPENRLLGLGIIALIIFGIFYFVKVGKKRA